MSLQTHPAAIVPPRPKALPAILEHWHGLPDAGCFPAGIMQFRHGLTGCRRTDALLVFQHVVERESLLLHVFSSGAPFLIADSRIDTFGEQGLGVRRVIIHFGLPMLIPDFLGGPPVLPSTPGRCHDI
ncbi:hypothetical protein ASG87_01610 [Frateuria sp. Soil773]|nr:hypothetical protein ASG87_01610 [Frateuria sp. Soil773]